MHAARGEGVHILQRSQDEAPSAGPPTALPPSAWVPVTLPDRWISPGRWPGHDGEVWYRVDWRNPCAAAASPGVPLATDSINMAGELWVGHTVLWRDRHLAEPLSRSWKDARVSVGMRSMQARMQRVGGELQVQSAPGATVLTVHLMPAQAPESQPAPLLLNMNQNRIWRTSSLRKQLLS